MFFYYEQYKKSKKPIEFGIKRFCEWTSFSISFLIKPSSCKFWIRILIFIKSNMLKLFMQLTSMTGGFNSFVNIWVFYQFNRSRTCTNIWNDKLSSTFFNWIDALILRTDDYSVTAFEWKRRKNRNRLHVFTSFLFFKLVIYYLCGILLSIWKMTNAFFLTFRPMFWRIW